MSFIDVTDIASAMMTYMGIRGAIGEGDGKRRWVRRNSSILFDFPNGKVPEGLKNAIIVSCRSQDQLLIRSANRIQVHKYSSMKTTSVAQL